MALVAGMRVGPYEVVDLLGAGGMGEVYRALDPRLGRQVALKVLPERFADSADRLRRFEREARSAGALSHPNILTVFDVGTHDGIPYLVSELLEGETVRTALRYQRFGVRKSLSLGLQVARGLTCAHEAGILHRDLKPENLFLARDGHMKILDFGLAKLVQPDGGASPEAQTATRDTDEGRVVGTAAYMSPEQIRDEPLDERCDIFALGAILFEVMSQRRAFEGPSPSDIMASILRDEPPSLAVAGAVVPPGVEAVVRHCLEKRREDRFGSAREVAAALQTLLHSLGQEGAITSASGSAMPIVGGRRRIPAIALGLALLVTAALVVPRALRSRGAPSALPPPPAEVPAAETVHLTSSPGRELEPALARDGQRVAFVWDGPEGNNFDLYTKVIGTETALRLTRHPAYDGSPAWSPDGRWIAFIRVEGSRGSLLLVPSTGGPERRLRDVDPWFGSSVRFSPDGRWVALSERPAPGAPFGVVLLAVDTRETSVLTRPDPSFAGDAFPAFSPDGETLAFARVPAHGASLRWAALAVVPAAGGATRSLVREDQVIGGLDWTRDGREIVFSASDRYEGPALWRVPVAGGRQVPVLGRPVPISNLFGAEALTQVSRFFRVSVAHDADRLAYAQSRYHTDIWKVDVGSARPSPARPLIASTQVDEAPQFSPDGRRIAFSSTRGSTNSQIWICDAEGLGCAQLTTFKSSCGTPRWSPDGERIVFDAGETGQSELHVTEVVTRVSRRLTFHDASDVVPSWSRDGASIYFTSDRTGVYEVWRMPAAGGLAVQITRNGGFAAFESLDGREVYFTRYAKPGLWAVPAGGGPERAVLDQPSCWGYWALGRRGVFVMDSAGPRGPRIALQRWGAARLDHVADVPSDPACGESGLALSPDERKLLYVGTSRESDIVMLDKFR